MIKFFAHSLVAVSLASGLPVMAEPTSGPVTLQQVRPYVGGNTVYIYVNGNGPCGARNGAYGIYTIDLSSAAGKAAYSAALAAVAMGRSVMLEAIADACGTLYPGLQSVYF